ncbi:MAG: ABC transporter substrate-binding protein, partial [Chloroflexales bacterium]|nr:ABC transporter substrate-binding protein [Chloroflexales bacterium]
AGNLPELSERLPVNPLVLNTREIGEYGGEWVMGMAEGEDQALATKTLLHDSLVRWDPQWQGIIPNLAESWTVEGDGQKYTFKLREGVKWSDGKPFTTADVMFWVDEVLNNPELTEVYPFWLRVGDDEPIKLTAPDDCTLVFE